MKGKLTEHSHRVQSLTFSSDKSLPALTKHIRQELLPTVDEDAMENSSHILNALPLSVVESAIKYVMNRNNYGLNPPNGGKTPASMCIWRWEVKEKFWGWLPKSGREKAEQRLAERVQVSLMRGFVHLSPFLYLLRLGMIYNPCSMHFRNMNS